MARPIETKTTLTIEVTIATAAKVIAGKVPEAIQTPTKLQRRNRPQQPNGSINVNDWFLWLLLKLDVTRHLTSFESR